MKSARWYRGDPWASRLGTLNPYVINSIGHRTRKEMKS